MSHWRTYLESDVVRFVDLTRDYAVKIREVKKGKVTGSGGKQNGKAMIYLHGWPKPIAAGTAFLSMVAGIYGNDTKAWIDQWVTIYGDPNVSFGGQKVGGVRVRPEPPKEADRVLPKTEQSKAGAA